MTNKKWKCPECNKEADYLTFDGYDIGDRLLEGVIFEARQNELGEWFCNVKESDEEYFNQFNTEMWLDTANSYVSDTDILYCPNCNLDIRVNHKDDDTNEIEKIEIEKTDIVKDIFEG